MRTAFADARGRARGFARDSAGASATEFALLCFPFLVLVFGVLGFGQAIWIQNALQEGVASGARCGALYKIGTLGTCSTDALTVANAVANATGLSPATSVFTVSQQACGEQVTASYPYSVLGVMQTSFTLSAKACFPDG